MSPIYAVAAIVCGALAVGTVAGWWAERCRQDRFLMVALHAQIIGQNIRYAAAIHAGENAKISYSLCGIQARSAVRGALTGEQG